MSEPSQTSEARSVKTSEVSTHQLRGYIIVRSGTVIWALTGIVIKILLTTYHLEALTIAFWRVFIVTTRRYSAWTSLFYAFLAGTIFLLPVAFIVHDFAPTAIGMDGWLTIVFLALVPTLGGFASYTIGLSHLPASTASILAAFEPVTTATVAYLAFGEMLDPLQLGGAGFILASVFLLRPKD